MDEVEFDRYVDQGNEIEWLCNRCEEDVAEAENDEKDEYEHCQNIGQMSSRSRFVSRSSLPSWIEQCHIQEKGGSTWRGYLFWERCRDMIASALNNQRNLDLVMVAQQIANNAFRWWRNDEYKQTSIALIIKKDHLCSLFENELQCLEDY